MRGSGWCDLVPPDLGMWMIVMICGGISVSDVMDRVSMPIGVSPRSQMIELGQLFVTNVASFRGFVSVPPQFGLDRNRTR